MYEGCTKDAYGMSKEPYPTLPSPNSEGIWGEGKDLF
jgi:hypothetical protein